LQNRSKKNVKTSIKKRRWFLNKLCGWKVDIIFKIVLGVMDNSCILQDLTTIA